MSDTEFTELRTVAVHLLNQEVLHVILENDSTLEYLANSCRTQSTIPVKYVLKLTGKHPANPTIKSCVLNTRWVTRINY